MKIRGREKKGKARSAGSGIAWVIAGLSQHFHCNIGPRDAPLESKKRPRELFLRSKR
jgi:hypothetical protein